MGDYRTILERDIQRVTSPGFGLQELQRRRDRRDRNRRIRAGVVGLALAVISIAVASRLVDLGGDGAVPAAPGEASKPGIWALDPETGAATLVWGPDRLSPPGDMQRSGTVIGAPSESPDGNTIAFTLKSGQDQTSQIYTISANGTDLKQVTRCVRPIYCPLTWGMGVWPGWSPDGASIAFTGGPNSKDNPTDVYEVNARGGDPRLLAHEPGEEDNFDWSPDGKQVVFDNYTLNDSNSRIAVVSIADGQTKILTERGATPLWSPDGRWIAFARGTNMWLIHPNGSREEYLTTGLFPVSWSPDSSKVAILQSADRVSPTVVERRYAIVEVATGEARTIQVECLNGAEIFIRWYSREA